ncbi:C3a anaphylatoxin chemotactic receptor-like isoform 2-T2 [Anomaloglossus baeobatrachus]|uniref:C3a anaphylatoxin chemotactic receptor-like isoform X2 n=1 Tax=Anomaloglossus baeobatrachus TaxID=238106 RepID=UPI003F506B8C
MDTADINPTLYDITLDDNNQSSYEYNKTSDPDSESHFPGLSIIQKVSITLYIIIFALGTIGNGLVIWITGFRMKKTVSAVWFLHLAIADFLCCASLPLRIAQWTVPSKDSLFIFCISSIFLLSLNMNTSVFLLTAMSIDRWVSVIWPFWAKVHRTCKLVRISAGIIWVFWLVVISFMLFSIRSSSYDITEWCIIDNYTYISLSRIRSKIRLIMSFIIFVIPFLIIVTSYVTIFFKLRKSKRSQRSQRSSRIITAVILGFFICWSPYYIWPLTPWYVGDFINFHILNIIVLNLACLNSCINPIIYVFMNQDFQQSFFRSIPSRLERALGENPTDPSCRKQEDCEHIGSTDG